MIERAPWVGRICRCLPGDGRVFPLAGEAIQAGFPSPAEDYLEKSLDLNELLAPCPEATFFVRVSGDSMVGAGIHDGDMLVVDRSRTPRSGNVVIAFLDGEFTVKRLRQTGEVLELVPENEGYSPIVVGPESDFEVWGVVRHVIHAV